MDGSWIVGNTLAGTLGWDDGRDVAMGLMGKGNREKQQEILDARKAAEKATKKWGKALFGNKDKGRK